ncbi:MAG: hypothetical protein ACXVH3_02155 [Solirubrobacteraceae bacterium]
MAADCCPALSVWRLTEARISSVDALISWTPAWISPEISARPPTIVFRLPDRPRRSASPLVFTVAVRSPSATAAANCE